MGGKRGGGDWQDENTAGGQGKEDEIKVELSMAGLIEEEQPAPLTGPPFHLLPACLSAHNDATYNL